MTFTHAYTHSEYMPAPLHSDSALGRLIRNAREAVIIETETGVRHSMTQDELASAMKSTQQTISRWEAGKIMPPMGRLHDLAQVLNLDPAEITAAAMAQAAARPETEPEPGRIDALEAEVATIKDLLEELLTRLPGPGLQSVPAPGSQPGRRSRRDPVRAVKKARG